jgi:ribulose kinase
MRGSIVGLDLVRPSPSPTHKLIFTHTQQQATGLPDLARKYHVTLEALALQTRHIIDALNTGDGQTGHSVRVIHVSGGQARNGVLMRLLADVCNMPVVVPGLGAGADAGAVVVGAAMLGRFAAEVAAAAAASGTELAPASQGERLWEIMVRCHLLHV